LGEGSRKLTLLPSLLIVMTALLFAALVVLLVLLLLASLAHILAGFAARGFVISHGTAFQMRPLMSAT
jgi:hypothetical protein